LHNSDGKIESHHWSLGSCSWNHCMYFWNTVKYQVPNQDRKQVRTSKHLTLAWVS